ncbi:MAG: poly-beta-1,6-N-acetyl-D-glucosamine biosynthesis protein PgaD [Gammaproteobacteria bacterium]|jgi:biofilm PGA synthesis protein PgaD
MADNLRHVHFSAPEEMTPRERARDTLITAILWAVYLYLWVPLVSLLAWAMGFEFAYDVMVRAGGARDLLPILLEYLVVVSIIFSAFTIWSVSNRLRYRDLKRRARRAPVRDEALSEYFQIPVSQIAAMRSRQVIHVSIDEGGRPRIIGLGHGGIYDEELLIAEDEPDPPAAEVLPLKDASAGG